MFPIIEVPVGSAEMFEQLGTKEKFWYNDAILGRSLFKRGRSNTGENWAEKLACELAACLGIPHAYYELARCGDVMGVVTQSFVPKLGRLAHGNEILAKTQNYKENLDVGHYQSRAHTIPLVWAFFSRLGSHGDIVFPPLGFQAFDGVQTAADVFVGYLMFDVWVGNQDRHDQNWGVVLNPAPARTISLAPSFDHGSSFARNESDAACQERLVTRDSGRHITTFIKKSRSGFYPHGATNQTKSMLTIDAFAYVFRQSHDAGIAWLKRLDSIETARIEQIVDRLPRDIITRARRTFLVEFLLLNRKRLLALGGEL